MTGDRTGHLIQEWGHLFNLHGAYACTCMCAQTRAEDGGRRIPGPIKFRPWTFSRFGDMGLVSPRLVIHVILEWSLDGWAGFRRLVGWTINFHVRFFAHSPPSVPRYLVPYQGNRFASSQTFWSMTSSVSIDKFSALLPFGTICPTLSRKSSRFCGITGPCPNPASGHIDYAIINVDAQKRVCFISFITRHITIATIIM